MQMKLQCHRPTRLRARVHACACAAMFPIMRAAQPALLARLLDAALENEAGEDNSSGKRTHGAKGAADVLDSLCGQEVSATRHGRAAPFAHPLHDSAISQVQEFLLGVTDDGATRRLPVCPLPQIRP